MHCKISDCFNCPYPDCINDTFTSPREFTPEQKKRQCELKKKILARRRENGVCIYCGKKPADKGYKSCTECRIERTKKNREYSRKTERYTPRELMDGVKLCKLCGKRPPVDGRTICEECFKKCLDNLNHADSKEPLNNGFRAAIEAYWRER